MVSELTTLPPQQLPFSKKTKDWRKKHLDWADSRTFFNYSLVRKSVIHKKINYDLVNGILHMEDMARILNPDNMQFNSSSERIPHYPIINAKLNILKGEEVKRLFDYRVIVTDPNAIAEIEHNKKSELFSRLQEIIQNKNLEEEQYTAEIEKLSNYFTYEWQDLREIRGNSILKHYVKELNIPLIFNSGFDDAKICGEEIYQCDIIGGEPTIERINPLKTRIFKSGFSNKVEDADVVVIEDFWSPGRIIDTYYDVLSKKDIEYIESIPSFSSSSTDKMDNYDERDNFIYGSVIGDMQSDVFFDPYSLFNDTGLGTHLYYDRAGNIRVLRVYWKSRRKIKKVKSYDPLTGEEVFNFYTEEYIIDKDKGEEEWIYWINEAWEGTKIGNSIYVNMRPKVVQYNRLSNPSKCHFGIIGSFYNLNDSRPFSLVDMMKPYNYLYDVIHDRLNKAIASNWGKILPMDLAKVPAGWTVEKWLYYAKVNHIAVVDSFKEGNIGVAKGKLAGAIQQDRGVLDAETGNYIQQHINLLEFIKMEMSEVIGISKQREGQVASRETVGGVERATLQSSYITEWLFTIHDDVKRRALECFLETSKIALKGRSKKFQYILSDMSAKIMEIDGDEFAESDYGIVVDNSNSSQELNAKLDVLAQAALQNQTLNFSSIMKLYSSTSLSEKQRMIEKEEMNRASQLQQDSQRQLEMQQLAAQEAAKRAEEELNLKERINIRDNETKILMASLSDGIENREYSIEDKEKLLESIRQFNERLKLDREKLELEKIKHKDNINLKTNK